MKNLSENPMLNVSSHYEYINFDNCYKVGHTARACSQKSACYIEGCNKKHMTVTHPPQLSLQDQIYTDRSCEVEPSSCFARNSPSQS